MSILSAPYFHDGSQPTLQGVVDWFDDRYKLGLSREEKQDLTAYLETVGDGIEPYEEGSSIVAPELEEFEVFMSTYETLVARRKPEHFGFTESQALMNLSTRSFTAARTCGSSP